MKKAGKIILYFILIITVVIGGAVAWLANNEDKIANSLLKELDARLLTDAHISKINLSIWKQFPSVSIALEGVWLMDSYGKGDTLLRADEVSLSCDALELIQGRYVLRNLEIRNAQINLKANDQDGWNTTVWLNDSLDSSTNTQFSIATCTFTNSVIQFNEYNTAIEKAAIGINWLEQGLDANGSGLFTEISSPEFQLPGPINWSGIMEWNSDQNELKAEFNDVLWDGAELEGKLTVLEDDWELLGAIQQVNYGHVQRLIDIPEPWTEMTSDAIANGTFVWNGAKGLESTWELAQGEWRVPYDKKMIRLRGEASIEANYQSQELSIELPRLKARTNGVEWSGRIHRIDLDNGTFRATGSGSIQWNQFDRSLVSDITLPESGQLDWNGEIKRTRKGDFHLDGNWNANDLVGNWEGTPWSLTADGSMNRDDLNIDSFKGVWDGLPLSGSVEIASVLSSKSNQAISGDIAIDTWGFNSQSDSSAFQIKDLQLPNQIRCDLDVAVNEIRYDDWVLSQVSMELIGNHDHWIIPRLRAKSIDGQIAADGKLTFKSNATKMAVVLHPSMTNCDVKKLFQSFNDFDQSTIRAEHLTGRMEASGSIEFDLDADFNLNPTSLDVLASVRIDDGTIKNLEAFQEISNYLRSNRAIAPLIDPDDLSKRLAFVEFEKVESPVYVAKGVVQIPKIEVQSSAMNITIEGDYGFDSSIDYTLGFTMRDLRNAQQSEFGPIEDDGLGQQFYISMTGSIDDPEYGWDREAQKAHRRENIQKEKELLKNLFKKSSQ